MGVLCRQVAPAALLIVRSEEPNLKTELVYPNWRLRHSSNMSHWASSSQMLLKMEATSASKVFVGNGIAKHDFLEVIARRLVWGDPFHHPKVVILNGTTNGWRPPFYSKSSASLQPKARKQHLQWSTDRGRRSERCSSAAQRGFGRRMIGRLGTWHRIEPNNLCFCCFSPRGAVGRCRCFAQMPEVVEERHPEASLVDWYGCGSCGHQRAPKLLILIWNHTIWINFTSCLSWVRAEISSA